MNDLIIRADRLSKSFTLDSRAVSAPRFVDILAAMAGRRIQLDTKKKAFWAVKDVSFELRRGENLGILGLNGAGKSTLLKIILGRLATDSGTLHVHGSVGGLIELGAGFHPEQTGRKNIQLNAKLLGASASEIRSKMPSIIEFAELDEFIDMPVKTYSSGMGIRLGFSIAIHFVKDLIVCDEILAVGDFEFKQKCYRKIHELKRSRSFILVSHSTKDIALFCDKALLLHKGRCIAYGEVENVVEKYAQASHELTADEYLSRISSKHSSPSHQMVPDLPNLLNRAELGDAEEVRIPKFGKIFHDVDAVSDVEVRFSCEMRGGELFLTNREELTVWVSFRTHAEVAHLRVGLPFFTEKGDMVIGPDSRSVSPQTNAFTSVGRKLLTFKFGTCPLNEGRYMVAVALSNDPGYLYRNHIAWINVKNVTSEFGIVRTKPQVTLETVR